MLRSTPLRAATALLLAGCLLGGGTALRASAGDAPTASEFVPIGPCRLLDTRPLPDNVGARTTPLGPGDVLTVTVWGASGHCQIPPGATALSMNVVAVGPTAASYLTVFPAGTDRPLAASLNWQGGQGPTPNAVTGALSSSGALSFFNYAGTVDLAVDVVGYYQPAAVGSTGPQGPQGPAGPPGGNAPAHVLWVAASGVPFTKVSQALASISDNDAGHRYVVMVAPGTYIETSTVHLKDYVDIAGSGQDVTTITCACGGTSDGATVEATGPVHTEVRDLTVTNAGGGSESTGMLLTAVDAATSIVDTTITATAGPLESAVAFSLEGANQPRLDRLNLYAAGASSNTALFVNLGGSHVVVRNSWIYSTQAAAFSGAGWLRLVTSTVNGTTSGVAGRCDLVVDVNGNPYTCS